MKLVLGYDTFHTRFITPFLDILPGLPLSSAPNIAQSHRLHRPFINQILFHALHKGDELFLFLRRHMANSAADVDEQIRHPGKKLLVIGKHGSQESPTPSNYLSTLALSTRIGIDCSPFVV